MIKTIPYVIKTLWRHRSRTLLTVTGSAIALFVFCFVGSVQEGMYDLQRRQSAKRTLIAFQANKFCPATSHLPQDYDQQILKIDGVREVVPIQVFTNNCRASLDVVVFYGIPPTKLRVARPDFRLIEGNWKSFESNQDSAVMGRAVANRRKVKLGDKFSIGDLSVVVAGIFVSDDPAEENYIYSHLDFLQRTKGTNLVGTVTQHEVLLTESADAERICDKIDERYKGGPVETDTRPKGVFQAKSLGDLTQLIAMSRYLGLACVALVVALVATTTFMSVQDRMQEHAILQTIGYTRSSVFFMVVLESVILAVLGGLSGVTAAFLFLNWSSLSVGAEAVTIAFTPSSRLVIEGVLVAILTGLVAGFFPAIKASKMEIVLGLRAS